ncbi:MAG: 16S rRNA (guanine(966)-N(2))-methyltransferase RsmD [Anaerolineales bacterium]|nr:16S rRNA (guanine(966)-N(2))-methyltransferase RsmD [Anaerolineales bacterium]
MDEKEKSSSENEPELITKVGSLQELLERASGLRAVMDHDLEDAGLAENIPFPFLALVGQQQMKLSLLLSLLNPNLGGVLLVGPRGTGKTTAVRSLVDLLPEIKRSLCYYGCMEEDVESGGMDAVCPDCAKKFGQGDPLSKLEKVRLVELPLNATLEDVVGGLDPRAQANSRLALKRGILSRADQNLLYVDEVNLLNDQIVDAILDAAAQGQYTVRRGVMSATYRSNFTLIGSMNPEEGHLRPQIMDRFGLRVVVKGLEKKEDRMEAYQRTRAYRENSRAFAAQYAGSTRVFKEEIQIGREKMKEIELPKKIAQSGLELIGNLELDSLRAEITLFEAARAHAVADARDKVSIEDLRVVAPMALRLRRSSFIDQYIADQSTETELLEKAINEVIPKTKSKIGYAEMRNLSVIGGKVRGFNLLSVPGEGTRPIMSKVKAALFNIVSPYILGSTWLDLFAGTGSVGIEALSRGASFARFVDNHKGAIKTINTNLEHTGLVDQAEVWQKNALSVLDGVADYKFDFVYIAPPQFKEIWSKTLHTIDQNPDWLLDDSWIIVQIDKVEYKEQILENLRIFDKRTYGSTQLIFYTAADGVDLDQTDSEN